MPVPATIAAGEAVRMTEGWKRRPRLKREIAWALALKFVALAVIWYVWFSHPVRMDGDRIGAGIYSSGPASGQGTTHARP
jgi:hypothetical protein